MPNRPVYLLDTRTKDGNRRMTSFSQEIDELLHDFAEWVVEEQIQPEELWFARVFSANGPRHVGNFRLIENDVIAKELAPEGSKLTLKDSRYTLRIRLRYMMGRL